ncbi:MAG: universal stress protein [Candidatus Verstraetearchaeota archaeon]|jgi:nucleotide-binding universal stress UspA family protein|nr:universal stress protein [Candidatus Verstraetearchaeota archaeon]
MYKTIMVGVDGSKPAEKAFEVAVDMAKRYDARLLIVSIYSPPAIALLGDIPPYPPKVPKEVAEKIEPLLKKYEEQAKKEGVKVVESKIVPTWDNPGAGFVTEAEKQGCALTVIGSRGLTGVKRALLGSVAEYVVKNAHCSVHVVR